VSAIKHHIPDGMLAAYAAGTLPHAFSVVVATHVSMCAECRSALHAHQSVGGVILDDTPGISVSGHLRGQTMALLDEPFRPAPTYERRGIYPAPVIAALGGKEPEWKRLGMGVRQKILSADDSGIVRLLHIPPGQAVPDHSHNGLELTLVLQGSFHDELGSFGVGDVEIGDEDIEHTPTADTEMPCICLAATDAPLRFRALMPRLLQPLFRI